MPLPTLRDAQARAADPGIHAWVSAAAGAGKTQLLAARVLRLLLAGARPERLLALTFTKAAAAEMRGRVLDRLGAWAVAEDGALGDDLAALGLKPDATLLARARTLFAQALDARGGLRIETIHAFAAGLLAAFPFEAGVMPDFAVLDDRTAAELDRAALDAAIAAPAYPGFADDLAEMSVRHGEQGLSTVLGTLVRHAEVVGAIGYWRAHDPWLRRLLGVPDGDADAILTQAMAAFECGPLHAIAGQLKKAAHVDTLRQWIACDGGGRCESFAGLLDVFVTQKGTPRVDTKKAHPELFETVHAALCELDALRGKLDLVIHAARHLRVGWAVARERAALQARAGALAFDDIIARAAAMLAEDGAAAWVRAKLDQRIDHILVDEAQDTNADQWAIITALSDEYFAGEGAGRGGRTLFAVGDHKQSIFGFQGADPVVQGQVRDRLRARGADIADVPLADNFRSVPAVLSVVDAVLAQVGHAALGLADAVPPHVPARAGQPGAVTLWPCVGDAAGAEGEADDPDEERGWVSTNQRRMADRLARQIRTWLDTAEPLPARARAIAPGDILVLVRKRGAFVGALVAALHREGVPVAGADRLALTGALAVKDCLSLVRFVLQPGDDLSLAEVLVSPLVGMSQDALFVVAHGRPGTLWSALRDACDRPAREAARWLGEALAIADFGTPFAFLETILSGGFAGRSRLLARLGEADRLALDELLSAALAFEADHAPSLQGFLSWLMAGDADLKRDPDGPRGQVRIMTIHGAKGLQAPVVILADATQPPSAERDKHVLVDGVPVFYGGKAGKLGRVGDACTAAAALRDAEALRLLYVALTRAEDLLFVGGALHKRKPDAHDASWYAVVRAALTGLGACETIVEDPWKGTTLTYAPGGEARRPEPPRDTLPPAAALPAWARTPAPTEARPPRPLTPSRIGVDDAASPPGGRASAERGRLLHALFERLPNVATGARAGVGAAWLARTVPALAESERGELLAVVLRTIEDPAHAALFGPDSLAEAPLAATVAGTVIAGKVDRLLIEADRVLVADFKTGARVPVSAEAVPSAHLRQMAAYHAALARIFPDCLIEAALLYTAGPQWIALSPALLESHASDVT